ncbi:MAG: radical SAM protein [Leptospirales bacterium]
MSAEIRPLGTKCNLQCSYCYQDHQREAERSFATKPESYNFENIKPTLEKMGREFTLFGGEPLLLPLRELEKIFHWGFEKFGKNAIQTNGTLITDEHIELFKKYKVGVGISIDGPGELNDLRWAGTQEKTRSLTRRTIQSIERLCKEDQRPCLIITLHKNNASAEKLPLLIDWLKSLDKMGLPAARLHILENNNDTIREKHALSNRENIHTFSELYKLQEKCSNLRFDVFDDINSLLKGDDTKTTCVWGGCDPYTTRALTAVEANGEITHCGKLTKEGISFTKANQEGFERYISLYFTPQENGGCNGCRFFLMCKGQCPGTSIDSDWRNKTEYCEVWKALLERAEKRMVENGETPLSLLPEREELENRMLFAWTFGSNPPIHYQFEKLKKEQYGQHDKEESGNFTMTLDHGVTKLNGKNNDQITGPGFTLHNFMRIQWVGEKARETWGERFEKIQAWLAQNKERFNVPECCREFQKSLEQNKLDPLWYIINNTDNEAPGKNKNQNEYTMDQHGGLNILVWTLGLDLLGYWPCSCECEESQEKVRTLLSLTGANEEEDSDSQILHWLKEILTWPMEWSSLHGITEIKTPVMKVITNTVATLEKLTVIFQGNHYPQEGATGLSFPYNARRDAPEDYPVNGKRLRDTQKGHLQKNEYDNTVKHFEKATQTV